MRSAQTVLTDTTPVDTGHARSNWILSMGRPYEGIDGSRAAVSETAADAGFDSLERYDVGRDGKIYLRNNVLYIQFLDRGWSAQAPAGFVGAAFMQAVSSMPRGRKAATRKVLKGMAKQAYTRTY